MQNSSAFQYLAIDTTGFALRLVLIAHTPIPREGELDLLTEAEAVFVPQKPKKTATKRTKTHTAAQRIPAKKSTATAA